ncbi:Metallo-hydrolase/oxidoreductase [Penicillium solitum]|uniref:Metallo-hydrolase/oxidoreductase n=1 Tax=Penicillium solitum TaxID=60172 RepID=UPI00185BB29C|nr:hypothetical protein HAV15_001965 [Penicillium sp. str. \
MLRIREGYLNYAPKIVKCIPTTKYNIEMAKNAADILEENRIEGENIEVDIGSHWDWIPTLNRPSNRNLIQRSIVAGVPADPKESQKILTCSGLSGPAQSGNVWVV